MPRVTGSMLLEFLDRLLDFLIACFLSFYMVLRLTDSMLLEFIDGFLEFVVVCFLSCF